MPSQGARWRCRWRRGRCGRRCCCGNWLRGRRCGQQSRSERQQEWPGWRYDRQQGAEWRRQSLTGFAFHATY
jgi:hypothetical protein